MIEYRAVPTGYAERAAVGMARLAAKMLFLDTGPLRLAWHPPEASDGWTGRVWGTDPTTIHLVTGRDPRRTARTVAHELKHTDDLVRGRIPKMGPVDPDGEHERRAERFARRALREWDKRYKPTGRRRWFPLEDPPREGAVTA